MSVIFFHAGFDLFSGGFVGVDVFFVISGYLITTQILSDLKARTFSLKHFYMRRARRILPALYLTTVLSAPVAWLLFDLSEVSSFTETIFGVASFSSNIVLWIQDNYFDISADYKPLLHTWSLAVEEQYYLLFPVVCLIIWRWGQKALTVCLVAGLCLSFGLGDWASFERPGAAFYLLPTRAWEILAGALVATYLEEGRVVPVSNRVADVISMVGFGLIVYSILTFNANTPVPGRFLLIPVIGTVLIILFCRTMGSMCRLLRSRPLIGIGLISYSLYLWHQPILVFARHQGLVENGSLTALVIVLATVPVAFISWRYVEVPFRNNTVLRSQINFRSVVASICTLGLLGWFGFDLYVVAKYGAANLNVARQYADPGGYVVSRWQHFVLRDFDSEDHRRRVVLVGDSYAQDVLNAVEESPAAEEFYLSAYHISARCGNVWTDEDVTAWMDDEDVPMCKNHPRYAHAKLNRLMAKADEIWLASSWKAWHLEFLGETLSRLRESFDKPVRVFGPKSSGSGITFEKYLIEKSLGASSWEKSISHGVAKTNRAIAVIAGDNYFINQQLLMCGSEDKCENLSPSGELISFDGGHLTAAGARLLGGRLVQELGSGSKK